VGAACLLRGRGRGGDMSPKSFRSELQGWRRFVTDLREVLREL